MRRLLKWSAIALGVLGGLTVLATGGVYISSEMALAKTWPMPSGMFRIPPESTAAEGARLAATLGCTDCHGARLEGKLLDFVPSSTVYGPNLPALAKTFSDADFDRAIRHAQKPDGSSIIVMPSNQFAHLTDRESGSLIAYIRSIKSDVPQVPDPQYGLIARAGLVLGMFNTELVARPNNKPPIDLGPALAPGRHIAMVACAECHNASLAGETDDTLKSPDLSVVASYDRADFTRFMRTGKAPGDRELALMSVTARTRFSHFSDAEVNALYDYLAARGQKLAAE